MGMQFNTGRGDSTTVRDRIRIVDLTDDGSSNVAGTAVATGVPLTMAYWCKPPTWSLGTSFRMTDLCLYHRQTTSSTSKWIYELQIDGGGVGTNSLDLRSRRINGTSATVIESAAYAQPSNGLLHMCGTFVADGASNVDMYLYANGVQVASNTAATVARPEAGNTMNQVMIGAGGAVNTTNSGASGQENSSINDIYEVAIWQVVLSDDEIAALAKGFRPSLIRPSKLRLYVPGIRGGPSGVYASPYGPQPVCALSTASPAARLKTQGDSSVTTIEHIRRIG